MEVRMSGTHGELYSEIGQLVVAANAGEALDLAATSEELSQRYANLNVPPDIMARAIARSLGAVGVSAAILNSPKEGEGLLNRDVGSRNADGDEEPDADRARDPEDLRAPSLFPSGVRLALLS
jgi:hypothetical protein